jgi:hypothetical protein
VWARRYASLSVFDLRSSQQSARQFGFLALLLYCAVNLGVRSPHWSQRRKRSVTANADAAALAGGAGSPGPRGTLHFAGMAGDWSQISHESSAGCAGAAKLTRNLIFFEKRAAIILHNVQGCYNLQFYNFLQLVYYLQDQVTTRCSFASGIKPDQNMMFRGVQSIYPWWSSSLEPSHESLSHLSRISPSEHQGHPRRTLHPSRAGF